MKTRMAILFDMFSIKRLALRLASDEVQGLHAAIFLIVGNLLYILFSNVAVYILGIRGSQYVEAAIVDAIIAAVITIFGVRACYKVYSGSNFIQAFIVLSVPALIYGTFLSWVIQLGFRYAVRWYGETVIFTTEEAAYSSMANGYILLEGGAMFATAIGLLSFYFLIRIGLKIAGGKTVTPH